MDRCDVATSVCTLYAISYAYSSSPFSVVRRVGDLASLAMHRIVHASMISLFSHPCRVVDLHCSLLSDVVVIYP